MYQYIKFNSGEQQEVQTVHEGGGGGLGQDQPGDQ